MFGDSEVVEKITKLYILTKERGYYTALISLSLPVPVYHIAALNGVDESLGKLYALRHLRLL